VLNVAVLQTEFIKQNSRVCLLFYRLIIYFIGIGDGAKHVMVTLVGTINSAIYKIMDMYPRKVKIQHSDFRQRDALRAASRRKHTRSGHCTAARLAAQHQPSGVN